MFIRSLPFCFAALGCLVPAARAQSTPATGTETETANLPRSTKGLGDYLTNTIWEAEDGKGSFRFRGDGTMVMPWHDFQWKPLGSRKALMFTKDWKFDIIFSEDMKTFEVEGQWKAKMRTRLHSAADDKKLEETLTTGKWTLASKEEPHSLTFTRNGKVIDLSKEWQTWEVHGGVLTLKGKKDKKDLKEDFLLNEDKQPWVLEAVGSRKNVLSLRQK